MIDFNKDRDKDGDVDFSDKVGEIAEEIVEDYEAVVESVLPLHLRMQAWARRRPATHVVWRAAILVVGVVIAVGGGILGALLPILPGWAFVFLGLAILASEFVWAHRIYQPFKDFIEKVFAWVKSKTKRSN
ncbi:MAG: hypothetical protein RLZZ426_1279 [Actinomycetota bacterium]|jgi:uncharacterized protein (TIGR02611 family)